MAGVKVILLLNNQKSMNRVLMTVLALSQWTLKKEAAPLMVYILCQAFILVVTTLNTI